jgi:hypothetical protein
MDATSTVQPTQAPVRRPIRRWWYFALLLALIFAVTFLGLYGYQGYSMRAAWDAAEAEADRLDPNWRLDDLLREQTPIERKDNAGLHIIGVIAQKKNFRVSGAANYDDIFKDLPGNARLNHQQLELLRDQLAQIQGPLAQARQLKDMPRGRMPITFSDDFIGTLIPNHQDARDIADWLRHDAYELAERGRIDAALESCRATLNTARVFNDDLFLIAHLIRVAAQRETAIALERTLGQGEAKEESLRAMQELVEREIKDSSWLRAMRGERAGMHMLFLNIRSGKISSTYLRAMTTGTGPKNIFEKIQDQFPSTMLKYYPEHLRNMTRAVEIAKLPIHEQRKSIVEWDKQSKDSDNPIITMLRPGFQKVYEADCRSQATLRSMQAALACERYRLKFKDWPQTLEELVKERLLDAVPLDPIDGRALRMLREKDGVVIYSLGTDQRDNRGHFDRADFGKDGTDVGIRLWDLKQRANKARPAVAVPDAEK